MSHLSLASSDLNQASSWSSPLPPPPVVAGDILSSSNSSSQAQAWWAKAKMSSILTGGETSSRIRRSHSSQLELVENWILV